jgi:phage FluMu protein Com
MNKQELAETNVRCPKCKSANLSLLELWKDHSITWEQLDGKINLNEGCLEPGYAYKVQGKCYKCKHAWTVRTANQITSVLK